MATVWLRRATIVLIGALMLLPLPRTATTGEPPPATSRTAPTAPAELSTAP